MKKTYTLLIGIVMTFYCQGQWQNWGCTPSNTVPSLKIDSSRIYAGTYYFAYDYGIMSRVKCSNISDDYYWQNMNTGITEHSVARILLKKDSFLIAGTSPDGVFVTYDEGETWNVMNTGLTDHYIYDMIQVDSLIFAGTNNGGVFVSTDDCNNWTAVNDGIIGECIFQLSFDGTILYAGTGHGVYLSSDLGNSWNPAGTGITDTLITALAVKDSIVFAGTNSGVFISFDDGLNWSASNSGLTELNVNVLFVKDTCILAGTDNGVFLSVNNGTYWHDLNYGWTGNVLSLEANDTAIFAGTSNTGVKILKTSEIIINNIRKPVVPKLNIYPNPSNGTINIETGDKNINDFTIELMDINGSVQNIQGIFDNQTIWLKDYQAGVYFIRIKGHGINQVEKIILY
jgi:hypothetical protein